MLTNRIIIASSKGGIGKSTFAAGIAHALAMRGHKVLLFDLDFENRSLDLLLGVSDKVVYDIADVALGRVDPDEAIIQSEEFPGLSFVPAPPYEGTNVDFSDKSQYLGNLSEDDIIRSLDRITGTVDPDYVIVDTSAGTEVAKVVAEKYADEGIVIASHQPTSIRAADNTAEMLMESGLEWVRMVIMSYDLDSAKGAERAGIIEIIDSARIKAIGVVPYDKDLVIRSEKGKLPDPGSVSGIAFSNIAKRIEGYNVPIFSGIKRYKKKSGF